MIRRVWRHEIGRHRALMLMTVLVIVAGCGGPDLAKGPTASPVSIPTNTVAAPTAAVGATTGAPCESGTLRVKDLAAIEEGWRGGLSVGKGRAQNWQEDAVLVELKVSCELFDAGFRWQATFFSREAQAYYSSDTTEVRPVNFDPNEIVPLPESEINFTDVLNIVRDQGVVSESMNDVIVALDVRVNTQAQPVGPPGIPPGAAVYHLALRQQGEVKELYIDAVLGKIHQFE